MAERRMFAKTIIDSDSFLDMALSTQALYFHLSMRADDDGFINSPKKISKMIGASDDEMKILMAKKFIIGFESGIVVIKHWKIHNYIQKDRYKPTNYTEEKAMLGHKDNFVYTMDTECVQDVLVGKDRLGKSKVSLVEDIYTDEVKEIIAHLNQVCNTSYKHTSQKTSTLIKARLKDGFTLDDFKRVHITKFAEWYGTDMQKYLRPETLYGTKFESYLNQAPTDYEKLNAITSHTGLTPLQFLKQQGFAE